MNQSINSISQIDPTPREEHEAAAQQRNPASPSISLRLRRLPHFIASGEFIPIETPLNQKKEGFHFQINYT